MGEKPKVSGHHLSSRAVMPPARRHHQATHGKGHSSCVSLGGSSGPVDRQKTQLSFNATSSTSRPPARSIFRPQLVTALVSSGWDLSTGALRALLKLCPEIETYITEGGILLIKIWLEVGQEEQTRRFAARVDDPSGNGAPARWTSLPISAGTTTLPRATPC